MEKAVKVIGKVDPSNDTESKLVFGEALEGALTVKRYTLGSEGSFFHGQSDYKVEKVKLYDAKEGVLFDFSWFSKYVNSFYRYREHDIVSIVDGKHGNELKKGTSKTTAKYMKEDRVFFVSLGRGPYDRVNDPIAAVLYIPMRFVDALGYSLLETSEDHYGGKTTHTLREFVSACNGLGFTIAGETTYNVDAIKQAVHDATDAAKTLKELRDLLDGAFKGTGLYLR